MALTNTYARYGGVTKTLHWLTVLLIFTLIPLGLLANGAPFANGEELAHKALLFSLHKTLGVTTFFVALTRIGWAISQPRPGLLNADNRLEAVIAETVHWLLYGSLLLVPLFGWIHHAATTGFAPIWWPLGQDLPFIPKNETLADLTAVLHVLFERVLVVSILLHIAGALKHRIVDRDQTLQRMLPGDNSAPTPENQPHSAAMPVLAALAAWATAIAIGFGFGMFSHDKSTVTAAALQEVATGWTVDSGQLDLSVSQFGSDVIGNFASWTAAIEFDDSQDLPQPGKVEVTVAIGSLTIGSVTDQAMGFDFLDAETFPTAIFAADLFKTETAFEARGSLTIKDISFPVILPFDLSIDGDVATMQASIALDRRVFSIGDNMPGEGELGFSVQVNVALVASRSPS